MSQVRRFSLLALIWLSVLGSRPTRAADVPLPRPLKHAHAHNDYLHPRPLDDALAHGFTSVEADVFLVDGDLLVAHTRSEIQSDRTPSTCTSIRCAKGQRRAAAGFGPMAPA
jgi:hypothetical protein